MRMMFVVQTKLKQNVRACCEIVRLCVLNESELAQHNFKSPYLLRRFSWTRKIIHHKHLHTPMILYSTIIRILNITFYSYCRLISCLLCQWTFLSLGDWLFLFLIIHKHQMQYSFIFGYTILVTLFPVYC